MNKKLGIVVGRFQTSELTEAHKKLIGIAINGSDEVLIFIGNSAVRNSIMDPLPYDCRKSMVSKYISESFLKNGYRYQKQNDLDTWILTKQPTISRINDVGILPVWCKILDEKIDEYINGRDMSVVIYGGRDSVVDYYIGKYNVKKIDELSDVSATKSRKEIYNNPGEQYELPGFRSGMIFASQWRYPTGYPTADVACVKDGKLLLCRKANRDKWCLIGGFFDPTLDISLEDTAIRELYEETGISAKNPRYITNCVIKHDFRYKRETDKILTTLYQVDWMSGEGIANDDIVETTWLDISELKNDIEGYIMIDHLELVKKFLTLYIK